jgi:hypothetical protein
LTEAERKRFSTCRNPFSSSNDPAALFSIVETGR